MFGNRSSSLRGAGNKNEIPNTVVSLLDKKICIWIKVILSQIPPVLWVLYIEDTFQGVEIRNKAERHQEIGTGQDSETRRKEWIDSIKKKMRRKREEKGRNIKKEQGSERIIKEREREMQRMIKE